MTADQINKELQRIERLELDEKRAKELKARKAKRTSEDELLDITEAIHSDRKPLDFASYQREVMLITKEWPIQDPDKVIVKMAIALKSAVKRDKHTLVTQMAQVLRALAELSDYVPISLERIAHISLSSLPEGKEVGPNSDDMRRIE